MHIQVVFEWQSVDRKPVPAPNLSHINFCAVVEQQIKNAVAISLFWVAFLIWRLQRLQVASWKVLESTAKYRKSEKEACIECGKDRSQIGCVSTV
jgi:hypothetical protein